METEKIFIDYLDEKVNACMEEEKRLILEDRKDEANLCKVKGNIYGIFKTLYLTSEKQARKEDKEGEELKNKIYSIFLAKAERIPMNWKDSYEKAKEHQDVAKILIEETKLTVVEEIKTMFYKIREVEE